MGKTSREKRKETYLALGTLMCIIGAYLLHSDNFNIRGAGAGFIYCGAMIHGFNYGS